MNREDKKCPFVTPEGCSVYEDRPGACRIYPLGRAASKSDVEKGGRERFFIVSEGHCLGFKEEKEWTILEWMDNERVGEYNTMNDKWLEIITSQASLGIESHIPKKIQMFFMASYNLDKFREFLFNSRFFDLFEVSSELKEQIANSDVSLMLFGMDWLKFSLYGEKSIQLKQNRAKGPSSP